MATRTLTFTPAPTVAREALTRTIVVGRPGFFHGYNLNSRPFYRFTMQCGPLFKSEADCLSALHAFHQGTRFFLYDGGPYGSLTDYVFAGVGDGRRTDFFLPNRHIGPNSFAVRTQRPSTGATSEWTTNYSFYAGPGMVFFDTGVRSGDQVQAKYGCQYLCNFAPDGIAIEQVAVDLFTANLTVIENPDPIPLTALPTETTTRFTPYEEAPAAQARFVAAMSLSVPIRRISMAAFAQFTGDMDRVTLIESASVAARLAVSSGDKTATINTGLSNSSGLTMAPEWNTTWWITSREPSAVYVGFGTQVASGGSFINWGTFSY